jgi:ATP-dependent RNA helicase RhlE
MVRQRALNLKNISVLVLDEFDRLLDMGFSRDIQFFVDGMSNRKQTVLFSATEEKVKKRLSTAYSKTLLRFVFAQET